MRKILMLVAAAGCMTLAGVAYADEGAELAKSKGCLGCHATAEKKVGPSFKDIAAKYKGKKDAQATLISALKEGPKDGKGHPLKVAATDIELKTLVQYVLSTK
jgi:cytochrome c